MFDKHEFSDGQVYMAIHAAIPCDMPLEAAEYAAQNATARVMAGLGAAFAIHDEDSCALEYGCTLEGDLRVVLTSAYLKAVLSIAAAPANASSNGLSRFSMPDLVRLTRIIQSGQDAPTHHSLLH